MEDEELVPKKNVGSDGSVHSLQGIAKMRKRTRDQIMDRDWN